MKKIKLIFRKITKKIFGLLPASLKVFLLVYCFRSKNFIIEPVNFCNIRCVACPWHTVMRREKKSLSFDDFMIIFGKIKKDAKNITFYQMGEPLLNNDLFRMIKICTEQGIRTNIATNGMLLGDKLEEVLDSGLSHIKIALDGIDKETHEKYRAGSDFNKIIENIKRLKAERDLRGLKEPTIIVQTLVNKYNQNQLSDLAEFARKYADKFVCKKMHLGRSEELVAANRHFETDLKEFKRENVSELKMYYKNMDFCPQFNNLVILSGGQLVQCCFDYEAATSFGNLLQDDYEKILKSPARKNFLRNYFRRANSLCQKCDLIQDLLTYKF